MSINQFFRILWARRLLIGATTAIALLLTMAVAVVMPPRYEATSRLMLDIVKPDPVTGETIAAQWARAYVGTQLQLVTDPRVASRVAERAGWTDSAEFAQEYRDSGAAERMDFQRWLAERVIENTTASMVPGSNILEITYASTTPEPAAELADLVRDAYVDQTLEFRQEAAQRNADWFDQQTQEIQTALAEAQEAKTDFERANGVILTDDLVDTDTARLRALAGSTPAGQVQTMAGGGVAPSAGQLAQIDAAIAAASRTLGPNHPNLQQLRQQRNALASSVAQESAAQPRMVTTGPSLSSLYSAQQARVLENAGAANEARRLATDVLVLRDQYQQTAARAAQLEQEARSSESGLTLLNDAIIPQGKVFPNYPFLLIVSLAAGLGIGVLAALLLELFKRRIRGVEELQLIDAPVLGAMHAQSGSDKQGASPFARLRGESYAT
ncbi:chain length determinant protein [Erythrobacter litoralis]|uniref:GumC family protein n=1 Tax=Erythrobacter litoralis TaxID=39960 RepID=UPI0024355F27|nr:Wzz/FepE/Etk N-terminal domain-containing protein [Erythrobacter litoralis]MDG6079109.1 chain length determinant protein [Erythrobacter litoralis]